MFLFIVVALTLLAIPATVFLVGQNQEIRKRAAPATTIQLNPKTVSVKPKKTFKLEARIDTGDNQIVAAELHFVFDPQKVKADKPVKGSFAPSILVEGAVDNAAGTATITVGGSTTAPIKGKGTIATISFTALEATGDSPISIRLAPNTFLAAVSDPNTNVLIGSSPASVTIKGDAPDTTGTPTPTPVIKVIKFGDALGNKYEPAELHVKPGEAVQWEGNFKKYPLKLVGANWKVPKKKKETTWEFDFVTPGTYEYYSSKDQANMKGKVIVDGAVPTGTTTPTGTLTPTITPTGTGGSATPSAVTISSPGNNESVATTQPTFEGKAPANSTVTITIYSDPITVVVTADASGNWSYQSTTQLAEGPHNVVVSAADSAGKTYSATSSFVVVASGAGNSGDGSGSVTGGSDGSGMPETGAVENTIILISLGVILLISGIALPRFVR